MSMVNFLVARVTEDEAASGDPVECGAKRKLIRLHKNRNPLWRSQDECSSCYEETHDPHNPIERALYPCQTLRVLAAVYADHPDYLEEWRLL